MRNRLLLLFGLASLAGLSLALSNSSVVNIAAFTVDPFSWPGGWDNYTGPLRTEASAYIMGYKLWEANVNARGGLMTSSGGIPVNLTIVQTGYTSATMIAAAKAAVQSGEFDFYFGPPSSSWTITLATVLNAYNQTFLMGGHASATNVFQCLDTPATRPPCTEPYTRRFPRLVGVTPPAEQYLTASINLMALKGAKTIVAWYQNEDYCLSIASGAYAQAQASGLKLLTSSPIVTSVTANQSVYDNLALQLKELNPDVVVGGSRVGSCTMFVKGCKNAGWLPRALIFSVCLNDPDLNATLIANGMTLNDMQFATDTALWDPRMKGPEFSDNAPYFYIPTTGNDTSPELFMSDYSNFTGGQYLDITTSPRSMAMAYALEAAVSLANSVDPMTVFDYFPTVLINSFFGKIGFNRFGQNDQKTVANIQMNLTYGLDIFSPLSSVTASFVYPIPTWDERTWNNQPYSYAGEQAIAVLVAVAIVFSLVMAGLTFYYRETKGIRASSPVFLNLMIVGSLLIYCGILTWTLTTNDAQCMAHWWLLGIGFIVSFGSLLTKTWRISRIFNDNLLSVVNISNRELLAIVGGMVSIELILLIIWTASTGRSVAVRLSIDPIRPVYDYMTCSNSTMGNVILIIAGCYKALIMLAGVWLSIRTWKIKYSIYNESRAVAFSMYNLFFFLVLAVIVELVISDPSQRKAQFVVRSIMILLGAFTPIAVIFLPKFMRSSHLNSENFVKRTHSASQGSTNSGSYPTSKTSATQLKTASAGPTSTSGSELTALQEATKKIERLKTQNSRLKKEVKELRLKVHAQDEEEAQ